jgi:hypothetical protein
MAANIEALAHRWERVIRRVIMRQSDWLWVRLSGIAGMALVFVTTISAVPSWLRATAGLGGLGLLIICLNLVRRAQGSKPASDEDGD